MVNFNHTSHINNKGSKNRYILAVYGDDMAKQCYDRKC